MQRNADIGLFTRPSSLLNCKGLGQVPTRQPVFVVGTLTDFHVEAKGIFFEGLKRLFRNFSKTPGVGAAPELLSGVFEKLPFSLWCERGDSNPYTFWVLDPKCIA